MQAICGSESLPEGRHLGVQVRLDSRQDGAGYDCEAELIHESRGRGRDRMRLEKSAALANGAAIGIEEDFLWNHVLRGVQVMHETQLLDPCG